MRPTTKTLFPLALTALFALQGCVDKGAGNARDSDAGSGSATPTEGSSPGECSDGADNDSDGDFDCNDSDCAGSPDCSEANTPGGCSDGADNDADGLVDCDDPDCIGDPVCGDGIEDSDAGECDDGVDNDGDGLTDCEDEDCAGFEGCDAYEGDGAGECADGVDNDSDGLTDCDDEGCAGSSDCEETSGVCWSLEFDGVDDSVNASNVLGSAPDMSIATWIKVDEAIASTTVQYNAGVIGEWDEDVRDGWIFYLRGVDGQRYLSFWFGSGEVHAAWEPEVDHWYRLAITKAGGAVEFYVDETLVGTGGVSPSLTSSYDLDMGMVATATGGIEYFSGNIAQMSLWDTALSASQLGSYWSGAGAGVPAAVEYSFDGNPSVLLDSSGNGNDGTIDGAAWSNACPAPE